MKRALPILTAAFLWTQATTEANAAPEPATVQQGSSAVTLVVTVDLGEDDQEIRNVVRDAVDSSLVAAGVTVEEDAKSLLVVEIRWSEGSKTDFAVTLRLGRDASALPSPIHSFQCAGCSAPQLLEQIEHEVTTVVPPALAEADEEAEPEPEASPPAPGPVQADPPPRRPANNRALRTAGLATLLTGSSFVGGAAISMVVWAASDRPILAYEWSLLGVGSAAVITGGIMYGVATSRERKRRARLSVLPTPTGITLSGRF